MSACPKQQFDENHSTILTKSNRAHSSGFDKNRMKNFEDRLSELPDEILVTILSLTRFNIVEASSTCLISKRWQYLWTHVKVLHFYFPKMLRAIYNRPQYDSRVKMLADKYVQWVNRIIQLHQVPHITDFKVVFSLSGKEFYSDIDEWISFAISKSVQRLEVNLSGYTRLGRGGCDIQYPPTYTPADKVYSLIKSTYGLSCIKSITQLSLTCVNVTGELIEHFLSNCPLLFGLRVSNSELLVDLKISGPSLCLKFLEISGCPGLKTVDIIYAPNLSSLICLEFMGPTPVVRHAPSLVDLIVTHPEGVTNGLPASYFSQLESLTLIFDFFWRFYIPLPFAELGNLKNLTFGGFAGKEHSFLDWTFLIEGAPLLLTFTLQLMSPIRIRPKIAEYDEPDEQRHLHRCLEVVKFVGNIDFELLAYFVEHAVALKTVIVDRRQPSLEPWQEFQENESSMELRNHALDLKRKLPPKIEVVISP